MLADPSLALASAPALQNLDAQYFAAVRAEGAREVATVRREYVHTLQAAASDPAYVAADQLGFIDAEVQALRGLAPAHTPLDPALIHAADARIDQALALEDSPYVRPGLVNAALNILEDSGQYGRAYAVARDEIARSDSPYYYQADLAEIAEKLGRRQEAIHLLGQAYEGSRGPATRFQWGQLYLSGLLRMVPQDERRIEQVGLQVLGELNGGPDQLADRVRVRLDTLDQQLRGWNRAAHGRHERVLRALRARVRAECAQWPAHSPALGSCRAFLASA